jgi:two-component system, NarL family, nitrate/nitrite response regulator NarL
MVPTRVWSARRAIETDRNARDGRWNQHPVAPRHRPNGTRAESQRSPALLIASPSHDVRRRWRRWLEGRFRVVEAARYSDLESGIAVSRPNALLLDVLLLPVDGISALSRWGPVTKVLLMVGEPNEAEAVAVLKAGARGYCPRASGAALVREAVDVVQKGGIWIENRVMAPLVAEPQSTESQASHPNLRASALLEGLTSREIDVARLIACGARNKEIATRLNITEATVKAHLTAVFRKFGLSDRLHLGLFLTQLEQQPRTRRGQA